MEKPTDKQVQFAKKLGLDVPTSASRTGLSRLLSSAVDAVRSERYAHPSLSSEIAARANVAPTSEKRMQLLEEHRKSGITKGSIVRLNNNRASVGVVTGSASDDPLQLFVVTLEDFYIRPGIARSFTLLYAPPAPYVHEVHAASNALKKRGKDWGRCREQYPAFFAFARPRIADASKFQNEYGEFWLSTGLEQVAAAFEESTAVSQKPPPERKKRYCATCGKTNHRGGGARCDKHLLEAIPAERYCIRCATQFIADKSRAGTAAVICRSCNPPKEPVPTAEP
ncbi:MAG: hypothetical protein ABIO72_03640 [Patescibacteria group bacterium]